MTTPQPPMPKADGMRFQQVDADLAEVDGDCITDPFGRHSCAASTTMVGEFARNAAAPRMVNLVLHCARFGLHVNWTPEGARHIAQELLNAADAVEGHNAAKSRVDLAAALGKPIRSSEEIERRVRASRNIEDDFDPHAPPFAPTMHPRALLMCAVAAIGGVTLLAAMIYFVAKGLLAR